MRSIKDRIDEIGEDPVKLKRAFSAVWIIAYSMLIIGFLIMVWVIFNQMS